MADTGLPVLAGGLLFETLDLLAQDLVSLPAPATTNQWGLFLDGEPVVIADNVLAFEFKQDFRNSTFPVEEGSFATYNKVQVPYDVRLQFSTGGSIADRQALIQSVDAIIGSTELFDAVTPEKVYQSVNPMHQSLRRTAHNGVGLLVIDVYCEEIRVTATQQFASSTTSSTSGTASGGTTTSITIKSIGGSNGNSSINQPQSPNAAPQVSDGNVQPVAPTDAQSSSFGGF